MAQYHTETIRMDHPAVEHIGGQLRSGKALVYSHRLALWESIGHTDICCHWCSTPLRWGTGTGQGVVLVDHIDGDKLNNDPNNLVPSCARCNVMRGRLYRPTVREDEPHVLGHRGNRVRAGRHECQWCGSDFLAELSRPNPRFCSQSCVGKSNAHKRWHQG